MRVLVILTETNDPNKMKFDTGEMLGHQKGDQECKLDIFGQNG